MRRTVGFTLIEVMIVIAIVALLATLALPAYQNYMARAQVSEGFSLATDARNAIAVRHASTGTFPNGNLDAGIGAPVSIRGRYVVSVTVGNADGRIDVLLGNGSSALVAGQTLTMQAVLDAGSLHWTCGGVDMRYAPSACR